MDTLLCWHTVHTFLSAQNKLSKKSLAEKSLSRNLSLLRGQNMVPRMLVKHRFTFKLLWNLES